LNAIELVVTPEYPSADQICYQLLKSGLLAKTTHQTTIRFVPPLTIQKEEMEEAMVIIEKTFSSF
jgi:ornithine--oxo-acid transaminase